MSSALFADRAEAGRALARRLAGQALRPPVVVLALPRGGVPIGAEVARTLGAPLDLLLVRKIGAPGQPELAVAAVAEGPPPQTVVDEALCRTTGARRRDIDRQAQEELVEIERRRRVYLGGRAPLPVEGATVVVVDDGIATGTTVRAALQALRRRRPARIVLAVPVGPADTVAALHSESDADEVLCLEQPAAFRAIGLHYREFHQVSDEEVVAALAAAAKSSATRSATGGATS